MKICNYGCNNEGLHQLKNGNFCCSDSYNKCQGMRKKNSEANINRQKSEEVRKKFSEKMKGRKGWSRGLNKDSDKRIKNISESVKKYNNNLSDEKKELRSKKMSECLKGKAGGYRKNTGRGKKGWYKSYRSDSSWELAYIIYNLEHNIIFERNCDRFEYMDGNVKRNYTPDFKLPDDQYIEIKGYYTKLDKLKHDQFTGKLIVLKKKELENILNYVIKKYGTDFISLYDNFKLEHKYNCKKCGKGQKNKAKTGLCISCCKGHPKNRLPSNKVNNIKERKCKNCSNKISRCSKGLCISCSQIKASSFLNELGVIGQN